jgi:outer membrane protein TolC
MLAPVPEARRVLKSWQEALGMVRSRSTALVSARAQIMSAQGAVRQALSQALPTLTGTGNVTHHLIKGQGFNLIEGTVTSIPDPATTWNAGLNLRVPVFAPLAWYEHKTAKFAAETNRLSAKEAERLALAAVADAIVGVVTAERLAEVSRVSLDSALSTLDLNRRRAQLGAASAVDVLRAEQEAASSRAQIVATDEGVRVAREALGLALGDDQAWGVTQGIRIDSLARDAGSSCRIEQSVETRPDILAARAEVDVAERRVEGVDWAFWPTVDAVSSLAYFSSETFTNGKQYTWTIGGVLTWELYDGGFRYGTRQVAQGALLDSRQRLTQAKRTAQLEVTRAMRSVRVAEANLAVSERSREIAKQSADLSRIAFLNGSGTSFDLVDTARRLRDAELDLAIKEFDIVRARLTALLALATCDI